MTSVFHIQKSAGIGGSERHLLALLPALMDRGLMVSAAVLTAPGGEEFIRALSDTGIKAIALPAGPDLNPAIVRRLVKLLRQRKPHLVHTHLIHADLHGQLAARLAGLPALSTVHGAHKFYRRQPYSSAARVAGHLAKRTIAISQHVARLLRDARIVRAGHLQVVHYGIDATAWNSSSAERHATRRDLALARDELSVAIAARLIPGKGHDVLIRAVAEAQRQGTSLRLLILGDGPIRSRVEATAREEGVADITSFLGFVGDVRKYMTACDVVAVPTQPELGEGFGLAALEAMAAGLPVVASRIASLPEVVSHGESGLLVDPRDVSALAGALVRLAADRPLRVRLGEAARRRAIGRFSLESMVAETVAVYESVLGT